VRVLIVEDSNKLRESVETALRRSSYAVDSIGDGEEGLWMAETNPYDVIVLDIMLPGMDGLTIVKRLRKKENPVPILLLTAKDTVDDRVTGLEAGADDYLIKPFALKELIARVDVLCRRGYAKAYHVHRVDNLELDTRAKIVTRAGIEVMLTAREYAILEYLLLNKGKVVSRTDIETHIYDSLVSPMSNVVDAAVCTLRKKISVEPDSKSVIHTKRGQGFVVTDPE
jgi:DNA-binding response OmpR family regulator